MIKKLKRKSYSNPPFIIYLSLFLLYIILPIYLYIYLKTAPLDWLSVFYLINIFIIFYLLNRYSKRSYFLKSEVEALQEKINILNTENSKEEKNKVALEEETKRYNSLKEIIERINRSVDLDSVAENLTSITFSLITKNKGACILYLVDKETRMSLSLFKTKKEDKGLIIKAKEGDIFDLWVLRHASPLLIEDVKSDFRFDLEKIESQNTRPISSLISSPLISENNFLGILRLDNSLPSFYSQDDLRLLLSICDFGAVALENGELFKRTEDLSRHDELTLLYTKNYFLDRLKEECERTLRTNREFSLLMLDIDYFKNYNDKFGHTSGDIVLRVLSQNITNFLKESNAIISRFGGEEFCIILPLIDKVKAYALAQKLKAMIEKTKIVLRQEQTSITVSIGVASFPFDAKEADEIILKVDQAMYKAKEKGRNQVCGI